MPSADSYCNIPKGIDPIDFLFGDKKFTVPESSLTPEMVARYYQRLTGLLDISSLHASSEKYGNGLESLAMMLHQQADVSEHGWPLCANNKDLVSEALPAKTPYQLLYFPIFRFKMPILREIPVVKSKDYEHMDVLGSFSSEALLFGKNKQLYFGQAAWAPASNYIAGGETLRPRRHGPYIFNLSQFQIEQIEWDDERLIQRIADGSWNKTLEVRYRAQGVLSGTAEILERRAKRMRRNSDKFEQMSIYYGR